MHIYIYTHIHRDAIFFIREIEDADRYALEQESIGLGVSCMSAQLDTHITTDTLQQHAHKYATMFWETHNQLHGFTTPRAPKCLAKTWQFPPRGPTPSPFQKVEKYWNAPENTPKNGFFQIFGRYFLVFFEKGSWGRASERKFSVFFGGILGSEFWIPVASRAFLKPSFSSKRALRIGAEHAFLFGRGFAFAYLLPSRKGNTWFFALFGQVQTGGEQTEGNDIGQRAENGGPDPSWLDFAFFGVPDFLSRGPKTL